jgi:hypothetical protein
MRLTTFSTAAPPSESNESLSLMVSCSVVVVLLMTTASDNNFSSQRVTGLDRETLCDKQATFRIVYSHARPAMFNLNHFFAFT